MLDENNMDALKLLGWLCFQQDKVNESMEYLKKANLINEDDITVSYMQGRCYLKMKQHNKAYDCFHKCLSKDPDNSSYWCSLGILFAELTQVKFNKIIIKSLDKTSSSMSHKCPQK